MTPNQMNNSVENEHLSKFNLNYDANQIDQIERGNTTPALKSPVKQDTTSSPRPAKHWRVQFLRHSARAATARGVAGLTPPYCPAGPTLSRDTFTEPQQEQERSDDEGSDRPVVARGKSPLRDVAFADYSTLVSIKYDPQAQFLSPARGMPHAVSTAHSGFQALILCGPGIGLSTFTTVPAEFPKALINVANRPMVWYVLDWCYRMGVTDITLITPPTAKNALAAALGQNPYLTSLPSPSPDLLAPEQLEFNTPTAELLRLPEVQKTIKSDFILLPCDLICDVSGDTFIETYLASLSGLGGVGAASTSSVPTTSTSNFSRGGEGSGRRGGLSIWYNTVNREESVKGEECDFMATVKLDPVNDLPIQRHFDAQQATLRKLVSTMPMSELWDTVEEDKEWKIRQSLLRKYGSVKCMTKFRDANIYLFPYWVKEFAALNEDFESISEDLVGTWAKTDWRKTSYRARFSVQKLFSSTPTQRKAGTQQNERPIEDELDLLSLSSTQTTQHHSRTSPLTKQTAELASRVQVDPEDKIISADNDDYEIENSHSSSVPMMPPMLSYILSANASAPLVRRIDTTPLLLSVSLLLAKTPSHEECIASKSTPSPFAHPFKVAATATIAPKVTISRSDTLIDNNSTISTQCVIKQSCIGSAVSIGTGSRITGCVIMDGATIGEKCVLTNCIIGKKAKIGKGCSLQTCEVQDGNAVNENIEGKGEKYLVGGLEDDIDDDDDFEHDDSGDGNLVEDEAF